MGAPLGLVFGLLHYMQFWNVWVQVGFGILTAFFTLLWAGVVWGSFKSTGQQTILRCDHEKFMIETPAKSQQKASVETVFYEALQSLDFDDHFGIKMLDDGIKHHTVFFQVPLNERQWIEKMIREHLQKKMRPRAWETLEPNIESVLEKS